MAIMSIRVESLTKYFGDQKAVDKVTFSVASGEIAGFLGPNGSGKSTTMKCICGVLPADQGDINVAGIGINEDPMAIKKLIGYLPENNPLHPEMFIMEYLTHVDGFYNSPAKRLQRVKDVIGLTGLSREQHKRIGQLSKGFRQRVGLAQAIIHNPSVLILDEPTSGLDPNQIVEIRNLISGLAKEKTVLLSTHLLQEVEAICDRIIVINNGQLVADATSESIKNMYTSKEQSIYLEFGNTVDIEMLKRIKGVTIVSKISDKEFLVEGNPDTDLREAIFHFASQNGLSLLTMQQKQHSLEKIFRELTGRS